MVKVVNQTVEILVNDKPIKQHVHNNRIFVEARDGCEYKIKVKNGDLTRVSTICSVDGLDVITGEKATDESPGYIVGGKASYTIQGFRTSDEKVHPFVFAKKSESYAVLSETSESMAACGVIGVKFFLEKNAQVEEIWRKIYEIEKDKNDDKWKPYPFYPPYTNPTPYYPKHNPWETSPCWGTETTWTTTGGSTIPGGEYIKTSDLKCTNINGQTALGNSEVKCVQTSCKTDAPNGIENPTYFANMSQPIEFDMGTKFSEKEIMDQVREENFEKDVCCCFTEIFYASREVLEKMGIKFEPEPTIAFPSSFSSSKYCKIPKNIK